MYLQDYTGTYHSLIRREAATDCYLERALILSLVTELILGPPADGELLESYMYYFRRPRTCARQSANLKSTISIF